MKTFTTLALTIVGLLGSYIAMSELTTRVIFKTEPLTQISVYSIIFSLIAMAMCFIAALFNNKLN